MTTHIEFKPEAPVSAQQRRALTLVFEAIREAVEEGGPTGTPGGVIYAALSQAGCSLQTFEQMMGSLVAVGALRREGERYFLAGNKMGALVRGLGGAA
jgi:hypothetical protein